MDNRDLLIASAWDELNKKQEKISEITKKKYAQLPPPLDDERSNVSMFGCGLDAFEANLLVKSGLLDSYEEGLLLENEIPTMNMRYDESKYDVVGTMKEGDYEYLIEKMREGVCDDIFVSLSSVGNYDDDIIQLIRYKDKEFGEKVRKYHLTLRGFLVDIIALWDED